MKFLLLIPGFIILAILSWGQTMNPDYDSTLARFFGADDYGMKNYMLVMLKTGSSTLEDRHTIDSLFRGHMENIESLADAGKLVVAGPLGKNESNYRGIFILNTDNFEEAHELLLSDPAIRENLLEPELFKWYGSAALAEYMKIHGKLGKYKF